MKFIWSKNNLIGSKAIRWGLSHDCSHFAIEHDGVVYESTIERGYHECFFDEFLKRNTVVHILALRSSPNSAVVLDFLNTIKLNCKGKEYDKKGVLWWSFVTLIGKFVPFKRPNYNQWEDKNQVYCVEILKGTEHLFKKYFGVDVDPESDMPHDIYNKIKRSDLFR